MAWEDEPFCYVTTTGRVTGRPHTIEIWFAARGATIYLLSGGGDRADWVRNLLRRPRVGVRVGELRADATARVVTDVEEDRLARDLVHDKYASGSELRRWRDAALPVAIDLPT